MTIQIQLLLGSAFLIFGTLWVTRRISTNQFSALDFYWANHELKSDDSAHLFIASSLSLNGLFYHTWLGYSVGIYSLLIQGIWCASFLILARYSQRLTQLCQANTLHGNIISNFGANAGKLAILASCLSFICLIGWELSIAGSVIKEVLKVQDAYVVPITIAIGFTAIAYTLRGGIKGNLAANKFQNYIKLISFSFCLLIVFYIFFNSDSAHRLSVGEVFKFSPSYPIAALGIFGLIANASFSLFWQTADMSTWQTVSSATKEGKTRRGLLKGAFFILVAPGLLGTLLGMSVSHVSTVHEGNIIFVIAEAVADFSPVFGLLLFAALIAVMLSTLDGQFLAGAQTLVWNYFFKDHLLSKTKADADTDEDETEDQIMQSQIMSATSLCVMGLGLCSFGIFALFHFGIISLFETVYLAVVGQMAIVPTCVGLIRSDEMEGGSFSALYSMIAGLTAGTFVIGLHIMNVEAPEFAGTWVTAGPIVTLIASFSFYFLFANKRSGVRT